MTVRAIPINVGHLEVPRLRAFERVRLSGPLVDDGAEMDEGQQDGQEGVEEHEMREVEVVTEGEASSPLTVMVLPS